MTRTYTVALTACLLLSTMAVPAGAVPAGPRDYTQFQEIWRYPTPSEVRGVAFSPNGTWVAAVTLSDGGTEVKILNTSDGTLLFTLPYQWSGNLDARSLAFSPNGSYLAVGGTGRNITVWDIQNRIPVPGGADIGTPRTPYAISFTPNGRFMLAAGERTGGMGGSGWVRGWDATSGFAPVNSISHDFNGGSAFALAIDPSGLRYAVGLESRWGPDVFVYTLPGGTGVAEFNVLGTARSLEFSPNGTYLAIGRGGDRRYGFTDVDIFVWDTRFNYSGQGNPPVLSVYTSFGNGQWVRAVPWSGDGSMIVSGGSQDAIHVWSPVTGAGLSVLGSDPLWSMDLSPNGSYMATAHDAGVSVWSDRTSPAVLSVEVWTPSRVDLPFIPNYIHAEPVVFNITFNEKMDTAVAPDATFGDSPPYTQFALKPIGWRDDRTWQGAFNFTSSAVPEGRLTLAVNNATDTFGNVMAPFAGFDVFLDAKPPVLSYTRPSYWQRNASASVQFTATDPDPSNSSELLWLLAFTRYNNNLNTSWSNFTFSGVMNLTGTSVSSTHNLTFGSGEGYYEAVYLLLDRAMNVRQPTAPDLMLGYDHTLPSVQVSPIVPYWTKRNASLNISYSVADNVNLSRVVFYVQQSDDNITWGNEQGTVVNVSGKAVADTFVYTVSEPGFYRFSARSIDESGLMSGRTPYTGTGIDSVRPDSYILPLPPYSRTRDLTLPFVASDATSGVRSVALYVNDGSGWTRYSQVDHSATEFAFTAGGEGPYAFYSIATDNASNVEIPPPGNDTWTVVDITPPGLELLSPPAGSTTVPVSTKITIRTSGDADISTLNLTVRSTSGVVQGDISWEGDAVTFSPAFDLDPGTRYDISVSISDQAGNQASAAWSFTTLSGSDTTPPTVTRTTPSNGAVVSSLDWVSIQFSESMSPGVTSSVSISPGRVVNATWYGSNLTLMFGVADSQMDAVYTVTVGSADATDLSGNPLDGDGDGSPGGDFVFSFALTLKPPARLRVKVVDTSGVAIAGANVSLELNGTSVGHTLTTLAGEAEFSGLMPGRYTVRAEKEGYLSSSIESVLDFGDVREVRLTLSRPGEVQELNLEWVLLLAAMIAGLMAVILLVLVRRTKRCPGCGSRIPRKRDICPRCGYDFIRKTRELPKKEEKAEGRRPPPRERVAKVRKGPDEPETGGPPSVVPGGEEKKDVEVSEEEEVPPQEVIRSAGEGAAVRGTGKPPPGEGPGTGETPGGENGPGQAARRRALERIRRRRGKRPPSNVRSGGKR